MKKNENAYLDAIEEWNKIMKESQLYLNNGLLVYYGILVSTSGILIGLSDGNLISNLMFLLSILFICLGLTIHFEDQSNEVSKMRKKVFELGKIYDDHFDENKNIFEKMFIKRMIKGPEKNWRDKFIEKYGFIQSVLQNTGQFLFILGLIFILFCKV